MYYIQPFHPAKTLNNLTALAMPSMCSVGQCSVHCTQAVGLVPTSSPLCNQDLQWRLRNLTVFMLVKWRKDEPFSALMQSDY